MKFLALFTFIFLLSTPSYAQEDGILINPPIINVSLVHHDYMEPEQFAIFMKVPDAVSGCFDVSQLQFETSFIENNYMDIEVAGYKRIPIKTKDVAFDCTSGTKVITAMIPLSATDLKERNIRQIRFKKGAIEDAYDLNFTDNSLTLIPKRAAAFKPKGIIGEGLTYSYGGAGLIALHVPMARKGEDISTSIKNFAYKYGMIPSDEKATGRNVFFFKDQSGEILQRIGENGYHELGTIQVNRSFNGGRGAQMTATPLKVFATRPNTTL